MVDFSNIPAYYLAGGASNTHPFINPHAVIVGLDSFCVRMAFVTGEES